MQNLAIVSQIGYAYIGGPKILVTLPPPPSDGSVSDTLQTRPHVLSTKFRRSWSNRLGVVMGLQIF